MRKFLFILIVITLSFADFEVSVDIGGGSIDGSFTYKGTKTYIKDIGIDSVGVFGLEFDYASDSLGLFCRLEGFGTSSDNYVLNKNIMINNVTFNSNEQINSEFGFTNMNIAAYYFLSKRYNAYLKLGAGLYGIGGELNVENKDKYSKLEFTFYYPGMYMKYLYNDDYQFGVDIFTNLGLNA